MSKLFLGSLLLCVGCGGASEQPAANAGGVAPETRERPPAAQPFAPPPRPAATLHPAPSFTASSHVEIIHPTGFLPEPSLDGKPSANEQGRDWWNRIDQKQWLALCPQGNEWALIKTRVIQSPTTVYAIPGAILASSDTCAEPMLFLTGDSVKPHKVQIADRMDRKVEEKPEWLLRLGGEETLLSFGKEVWLPLVAQTPTASQIVFEHRQEAEHLGKFERTPLDYGYASMTRLLWAGDLNEDGYLDYYFNRGDAEVGVTYELFLSGGGKAPRDVQLADVFDVGGC